MHLNPGVFYVLSNNKNTYCKQVLQINEKQSHNGDENFYFTIELLRIAQTGTLTL